MLSFKPCASLFSVIFDVTIVITGFRERENLNMETVDELS